MFGYAKNFLRPFDMFGYSNFLFYKSKKKFKTSLFGLFSLLFILIIISKFITNVLILFQDERETNNIVYYKLKDQDKSNIKKNKLPMIFQIEVKDIIERRKIDFSSVFGEEMYVRYNKYQNKSDGVLKKYNMSDIVLPLKDLEINQNVLESFDYNLFKDGNFIMSDYYECNSLYFVNLTKINIDKNFNGTLSFIFQKSNEESYNIEQIYMQFNFISIDTVIQNIKRRDNFYKEILRSHFLTTKIKNGININLKKTLIKSYTNKFMHSKSYDELEIIRYEFEQAKDINNFFEINISLYDKTEIYERSYFNLVILMSECGGLISTFKSLIFLVHLFYEYYFLRNLRNLVFLDDKNLNKSIPNNFKRITQKIFFKKNKHSFFESLFKIKKKNLKNLKSEKFSVNNFGNLEKEKSEYFSEENHRVISMSHINPKSSKDLSVIEIKEKNVLTEEPFIKTNKKRKSFFKILKKSFWNKFTYHKSDVVKLKDCIKELLDIRRLLMLQIRFNEFFNFMLDNFQRKTNRSNNSIGSYVSIESFMDNTINR